MSDLREPVTSNVLVVPVSLSANTIRSVWLIETLGSKYPLANIFPLGLPPSTTLSADDGKMAHSTFDFESAYVLIGKPPPSMVSVTV